MRLFGDGTQAEHGLARDVAIAPPVNADVRPDELQLIIGRKVLFTIKPREPILWADIEGGRKEDQQSAPRD